MARSETEIRWDLGVAQKELDDAKLQLLVEGKTNDVTYLGTLTAIKQSKARRLTRLQQELGEATKQRRLDNAKQSRTFEGVFTTTAKRVLPDEMFQHLVKETQLELAYLLQEKPHDD